MKPIVVVVAMLRSALEDSDRAARAAACAVGKIARKEAP